MESVVVSLFEVVVEHVSRRSLPELDAVLHRLAEVQAAVDAGAGDLSPQVPEDG